MITTLMRRDSSLAIVSTCSCVCFPQISCSQTLSPDRCLFQDDGGTISFILPEYALATRSEMKTSARNLNLTPPDLSESKKALEALGCWYTASGFCFKAPAPMTWHQIERSEGYNH